MAFSWLINGSYCLLTNWDPPISRLNTGCFMCLPCWCDVSWPRCLEHFCRGNEFTPKALEDFGAEEIRIRLADSQKCRPHGFPHGFEELGLQEFVQTQKTKKKNLEPKRRKVWGFRFFLVLFGEVFCCLFSGFESLNFYELTAEISQKIYLQTSTSQSNQTYNLEVSPAH